MVIAVEKIQRYIFRSIDKNPEDQQSLRKVIVASNQVADDILEEIKRAFDLTVSDESRQGDTLLWISGKVVFDSGLPTEEIQSKLKNLFEKIYTEYQGDIFLKYAVFSSQNKDKMQILHEAENLMKDPGIKGAVLKNSQELLFRFQETDSEEKRKRTKKSFAKPGEEEEWFASDMDELVVKDEKHKSKSTDGKIAIVKADINNLGRIMSEVADYDIYIKRSRLLEEKISVKNIAKHIKEYSHQETKGEGKQSSDFPLKKKILPFYIAGDDIFYAVRIDSVLDSIHLLHRMTKELNHELKGEGERINLSDSTELSLAVGVVFVNNHQPIRYYRQMVEKELAYAKRKMKTEKSFHALVGIRMARNSFHIYKEGLGLGESDGFRRFCAEVQELQAMMEKKIFRSTELHGLLLRLQTEPDLQKRFYTLMYFLKPDLQRGEKENEELFVKYYWLSQLVGKSQEEKKEKTFDLEKIQNLLIPKLELILLFLDKKYSNPPRDICFRYIQSVNRKDQKKRMRSVMFHKPLNYFLAHKMETRQESDLRKDEEEYNKKLVSLFIRLEREEPTGRVLKFQKAQGEKVKENKQLYRTVNFHPSVFYRAKRLIETGKAEQVSILFENYQTGVYQKKEAQSQIIEGTTLSSDVRKNKGNVHRMKFEIEEFQKLFDTEKKEVGWLDQLILLFEYNQQRIILKTTEKKEKSSKKNRFGSHKAI